MTETDRQRQTETEGQRETETDGQRETETDRDRGTDRDRERQRQRVIIHLTTLDISDSVHTSVQQSFIILGPSTRTNSSSDTLLATGL